MKVPRVAFLLAVIFTLFTIFETCKTAVAQTPTITVLHQSPTCLTSGCITTLTATVTSGSIAVHPGLVYFCEGSGVSCENQAPLGTAQLLPDGTATIRLALTVGTRTIRAIFHGTKSYSRSESSPQAVSTPIRTEDVVLTGVAATGSNGGYTLSATALGFNGPIPATGTVSFVDTTNNNALVTTAPLEQPVTNYVFGQSIPLSEVSATLVSTVVSAVPGDFNNDGTQDLALLDPNTVLAVLESSSDGQYANFARATNSNLVTGGRGPMLAADFNSDGKLDIAIPNPGAFQVHTVLGNGDGTFTPEPTTKLSESPQVLALGDFNNDGIPDLVALGPTPFNGSALCVLLGQGDGTFKPQPLISFRGDILKSLVVADFNHDGNQDLGVLDPTANKLLVFRGYGDGTFNLAPVTVLSSAATSNFLLAPDLDGDGIPDLLVAGGAQVTFLHGNGDFTFSQASSSNIAPGGGVISQFRGGNLLGNGAFTIAVAVDNYAYGPYIFPSILGSLLVDQSYNFQYNTSFGIPAGYPVLVLADFNGDGVADVLSFNNDTGAATTTPPSGAYADPYSTATASSGPGFTFPLPGLHRIQISYSGDAIHPATSCCESLLLNSTAVYLPGGFTNTSGLTLNGSASLVDGAIQLTDGKQFEAGSFFYPSRMDVSSFSTAFDFQLTDAVGDGFAFVLQNNGPDAVGSNGGGLGYGNPPPPFQLGPGITNSVAVAFDLHNNQGEGSNSVRLEYGGVTSGSSIGTSNNLAVDLTSSGLDLHSGHRFHAVISNGTTGISVALTDTVTNKKFTGLLPFPVGYVAVSQSLGGSIAYVGFTGGTGAGTAVQTIDNWIFTSTVTPILGSNYPTYPDGFAGASGLNFHGGAKISGNVLQLTQGTRFEMTSASFGPPATFYDVVYPASFATDFDFQIENGVGDGFTFYLAYPYALANSTGADGGGLGYGPQHPGELGGIPNSVAIKFDTHNNAGEGGDSTGLYLNGASPTIPSVDLSSTGINLSNGHVFHAHIATVSNGLTLTITDLQRYKAFTTVFPVNLASANLLSSQGAVAGFTAGTGETPSSIKVLNWTWTHK